MARLKEIYRKEIAPKLKEELKLSNVMEVPRVTKITLNMGLGEAIGDKKVIEHAVADLEKITGQKVVVTYARKSIAGFKVREGWPIGVKVTLRRERMYAAPGTSMIPKRLVTRTASIFDFLHRRPQVAGL
ncbi:large ribosomal subunit protein uL5, partial [Pseudomonas vancouverensis]|uniref:large ribosomal subunit protein uL5 n=1 Tax=Pseudomonas vancouverensis TaxID=95300 RepID=UPI003CFDAD0A